MNPVVTMVLASIRDIHRALAWVAVLGNAVAGLWALGAHRSTALRGTGPLVVDGGGPVGDRRPGLRRGWPGHRRGAGPAWASPPLGSVAVVSVGVVYGYRHQVEARRHLVYGLAGLFLMGLGIRAMVIGPG